MRILRKVVHKNPRELTVKDFDESIEHGIEEKIPWDKVRLEHETKAKIMEAINTFLQADENQRARRGMIFSGPLGTGKTLIAKSLASEKQCYFLAPTLAEPSSRENSSGKAARKSNAFSTEHAQTSRQYFLSTRR